MKTVLGLKTHSGWAALVVLGEAGGEWHVVERRRIELVKAGDAEWARQPFHAAEHLDPENARNLVQRAVVAARRMAAREVRAAAQRALDAKHEVAACAVLVGGPMPDWSVDEILAVHFRMHKAEGALFQDVVAAGARSCGMACVPVPASDLAARARAVFGRRSDEVVAGIALLGKSAGPPWGKDQKDAALAAAIALRETGNTGRPAGAS